MPDLGLPAMVSPFVWHIRVMLFVKSGASNAEIQFIRDSVSVARTILNKYSIGLAIIPPGGSGETIGTFSHIGPLFQDTTDSYGRPQTIGPGAIAARTEVDAKVTGNKAAPVFFGNATTTRSRGYTETSSPFQYFSAVSFSSGKKTTMLHEVGHCADMQHYMACTDMTDSTTQDDKNIMAEVTDDKADLRVNLNQTEIGNLKGGYFFFSA